MEQTKYAIPTTRKLERTHKRMLKRLCAERIKVSETVAEHYLKFTVKDEFVLNVVKMMCKKIGLKLYSYTARMSDKILVELN